MRIDPQEFIKRGLIAQKAVDEIIAERREKPEPCPAFKRWCECKERCR